MRRVCKTIPVLTCLIGAMPVFAGGGWVNYTNETETRMPDSFNDPLLGTDDPEEKDYAWGDVDNDGDIDLVVVRKQPFTSTGKETNVLFMNEGIADGHAIDGVFVMRTGQYASDSDVSGDQGFRTPTNDRDVVLVDVDLDGWLDMVTATTLTDNQPKHLSHPRVYMNKGEVGGEWQGFRYEDARIPEMHATAGPRFCSVAAGDLTGDGYPDLYFGDYDSGGAQIFDYNNRLLINDGKGFFTDETSLRLTSEMSLSAFGAASVIADINDDGVNDVVKQTSLASPTHIAITYNDPSNEGFFNFYDTVYGNSPYFVSVGDLNGDGRLDLVITDDGTDRYLLNEGNDGSGHADYTAKTLPTGPSAGFGSNSVIADLNNDGHNDVLIADVDVDIPGCSRRMHIYRNLGDVPSVTFQEQGEVIPSGMLTGTHDVAVFDINGDGWLDLVIGRCTGTQIWMNEPPIGLVFTYPGGLPGFVAPDAEFEFDVQVTAFGGGTPEPGTGKLFAAVGGGSFVESSMVLIGENLYRATLPAAACTESISFYITAEMVGGAEFSDPPSAPIGTYTAIAAAGTEITFRDDIEGDVSGWTITSHASVTTGEWEAAEPNGTIFDGEFAAPDDDATQGEENVRAFVTENGPVGGDAGANDLDGGPTYLMSPGFDLAGSDATISYARWFYCNDEGDPIEEDEFLVEISSNDGGSWVSIPEHTTTGTGSAWETVSFVVSDYVTPSSTVRIRFIASDSPNDSITEAGIDNFQVERILCGAPCPADVDNSGAVDIIDLLAVLSAWGECAGCPADIDENGVVDILDLLAVLSAWGPC